MNQLLPLDKLLSLAAIDNGTVIDHIDQGKALLLSRILKIDHLGNPAALGLNLKSPRMGIKDIIKVKDFEISAENASKIAIFSREATVNIIENHSVIEKYTVKLPETIESFIICPNRCCITNHEKINAIFYVCSSRKELYLACHYCEKTFNPSELKLNL